jgi:hypothetical protein
MAGVTQGITGMVEGNLRPGVDIVAVRALARPMPGRCSVTGEAVLGAGMLVAHRIPVDRIMAGAAGSRWMGKRDFVTTCTIRKAQV